MQDAPHPARRAPPELTIVVPCYNEEEALPGTVAALRSVLGELERAGAITRGSHLLLVDDGSRDGTWQLISREASRDVAIRGLKLSRNRGHQNALLAGLHHAGGDAVISIDADLQDDIGVIPRMLEAYRDGAEIVYGVRDDRRSDAWLKRVTAEAFYRVLGAIGGGTIFNHADYRLMSRRALNALRDFTEVNLFLRGVVPLLGFRQATVTYARLPRQAGEPKYTVPRLLGLALNGVTSFSAAPLRAITALGLATSFLSLILAGWVLWARLVTDSVVPGWASTLLPVALIGGVQLLALGVIGEYVAKIYLETKRRPPYIIEETRGMAGGSAVVPKPDTASPETTA